MVFLGTLLILAGIKRKDIEAAIAGDLKHIHYKEGMQAELRMLYNSRRGSDLSLAKSRKETIQYCAEVIKKLNHGKAAEYDKVYFEG